MSRTLGQNCGFDPSFIKRLLACRVYKHNVELKDNSIETITFSIFMTHLEDFLLMFSLHCQLQNIVGLNCA